MLRRFDDGYAGRRMGHGEPHNRPAGSTYQHMRRREPGDAGRLG